MGTGAHCHPNNGRPLNHCSPAFLGQLLPMVLALLNAAMERTPGGAGSNRLRFAVVDPSTGHRQPSGARGLRSQGPGLELRGWAVALVDVCNATRYTHNP